MVCPLIALKVNIMAQRIRKNAATDALPCHPTMSCASSVNVSQIVSAKRQPRRTKKIPTCSGLAGPSLLFPTSMWLRVAQYSLFTLFRIPERQLDWAYYLKRPRFRHSSGSPPCLGPVTILFTRACPPLTAHRALDKVPPFDMAPSIPLSKSVPIAIPFTSASAVRNMNLPAPSLRSSSEETAK